MVAELAALKDPDGVAAGVATTGVAAAGVAGVSGTTTAVQAPLFNSKLALQDAIIEYPGHSHTTAAFAIASHAAHVTPAVLVTPQKPPIQAPVT